MEDWRYDFVSHFYDLNISREALTRYIRANIRPISSTTVRLAIRAPEKVGIEVRATMIQAIKQLEKERKERMEK